jgi:hypothetical protein
MNIFFWIKYLILALIPFGISFAAIVWDWKLYFKQRKKDDRKLLRDGIVEKYILIGLAVAGFGLLDNIGSHGGFYYCYLVDVYHSSGWVFALIYIIGSLSLSIIGKITKFPFTKDDWKYWASSRIGIFLMFYILGLLYFWFVYGPSPAHAWPPKYSMFTRF